METRGMGEWVFYFSLFLRVFLSPRLRVIRSPRPLFGGIEAIVSAEEGFDMPGNNRFIIHDHIPLTGTSH